MNELSIWLKCMEYFLSSFRSHSKNNSEKSCDYDISAEMKHNGLIFRSFHQPKIDPVTFRIMCFLYYGTIPELVRLSIISLFLDTKSSSFLCDQSIMMPQYRWASLTLLIQYKLLFCYYHWTMKVACENSNQLKWFRVYEQNRLESDLKYISTQKWNQFRRKQNQIYQICYCFFKVSVPLILCPFSLSPLYFHQGSCNISTWFTCLWSAIHLFCCLSTANSIALMPASFNHILRYRLDRILEMIENEEYEDQLNDRTVFQISIAYLNVYRDFDNSRKVLCRLIGSFFVAIFSIMLNFYFLFLTTDGVLMLQTLILLACCNLTIFWVGIVVVHMSSTKVR